MALKVVELVKHRNYDQILELFAANPKPSDLDCWALDGEGGTLLHQVVALRPPVTLVDLVISRMMASKANSIPEDSTDHKGKTPLHIAAAVGCSYAVINRLTNGTVLSSPVLSMDHEHRLPLHWACTNPHGKASRTKLIRKCGARSRDKDNMLQVMEKLVQVYPHAVWARDCQGKTPYDLAKANRADSHTLTLLRITMNNFAGKRYSGGKGSTDATSAYPGEVSEVSEYDCADDDVSSIGTGGASAGPSERRRFRKLPRFTQVNL